MKLAIADNRISIACERSLLKLGFRLIKLPASKHLPPPLASHPDMLIFAHENNMISSCDYAECADLAFSDISWAIDGVRLSFTMDKLGSEYPYDCIYNALVIGDKLFAKTDTCSGEILSYAERRGLKIVHTRQGYPACTVLPLGAERAITADSGMAKLLSENGINVTLIENGGISLPPYEYGFIGGCAGVLDGTVYFLGDPKHHRDFDKISTAIKSAGMSCISLSDEPLSDLGRLFLYDIDKDRTER